MSLLNLSYMLFKPWCSFICLESYNVVFFNSFKSSSNVFHRSRFLKHFSQTWLKARTYVDVVYNVRISYSWLVRNKCRIIAISVTSSPEYAGEVHTHLPPGGTQRLTFGNRDRCSISLYLEAPALTPRPRLEGHQGFFVLTSPKGPNFRPKTSIYLFSWILLPWRIFNS